MAVVTVDQGFGHIRPDRSDGLQAGGDTPGVTPSGGLTDDEVGRFEAVPLNWSDDWFDIDDPAKARQLAKALGLTGDLEEGRAGDGQIGYDIDDALAMGDRVAYTGRDDDAVVRDAVSDFVARLLGPGSRRPVTPPRTTGAPASAPASPDNPPRPIPHPPRSPTPTLGSSDWSPPPCRARPTSAVSPESSTPTGLP